MFANVFDSDFASNDLLGKVEIDVSNLFTDPEGTWINEVFNLLDESAKMVGTLYMQVWVFL